MIQPTGAAPVDPRVALYQTAQALEALFMRQMLQAMRDASPAGGLVEESAGERLFGGMFDDAMASQAVEQNERGLAAALYRQLSRHLPGEATAAVGTPEEQKVTDAKG